MTAAKGKGASPISRLAEAVLFATQPADCNPFGSRSLPDQDISNAAIADLSLRSMTGSPGAPSPASSDRDIKPTTPKLAASPLRRHAAICQLASQRALSSSAIRSEEHTSELQSLMRISYAVFCLEQKDIQRHTPTRRHETNKT